MLRLINTIFCFLSILFWSCSLSEDKQDNESQCLSSLASTLDKIQKLSKLQDIEFSKFMNDENLLSRYFEIIEGDSIQKNDSIYRFILIYNDSISSLSNDIDKIKDSCINIYGVENLKNRINSKLFPNINDNTLNALKRSFVSYQDLDTNNPSSLPSF